MQSNYMVEAFYYFMIQSQYVWQKQWFFKVKCQIGGPPKSVTYYLNGSLDDRQRPKIKSFLQFSNNSISSHSLESSIYPSEVVCTKMK